MKRKPTKVAGGELMYRRCCLFNTDDW